MSFSTFSNIIRIIILLISFFFTYTLNFLADDNIFFSYLKYTLFLINLAIFTEALTKYSSGRSEMWSLVIGNVLDGKHIFFEKWD